MGEKITLNYDSVIELKNAAALNFTDKIHFHDACGGQYFSLDQSNEKMVEFIKDYFDKKVINAVFTDDKLNFYLEKNK